MANKTPVWFEGGFGVYGGDDTLHHNYTEATGNVITLQKGGDGNEVLQILNKGELEVASVSGATSPALKVSGLEDQDFLNLTDSSNSKNVLTVYRATEGASGWSTNFKVRAPGGLTSDDVALRIINDTGDNSPPTAASLLSMGYTDALDAYQEMFTFTQGGAVTLQAGSSADITWATDGAGDLGASGDNRPANVYASTTVNGNGTVIKAQTLELGPTAANNKVITALQTGTNDPAIRYSSSSTAWEFSNDGTTYQSFPTEWDNIYDSDADSTLTVDTSNKPFKISQTSTQGYALHVVRDLAAASTDSPLLYLHDDNAGDDQPVLEILQDGSGESLKTSAGVVSLNHSSGATADHVDINTTSTGLTAGTESLAAQKITIAPHGTDASGAIIYGQHIADFTDAGSAYKIGQLIGDIGTGDSNFTIGLAAYGGTHLIQTKTLSSISDGRVLQVYFDPSGTDQTSSVIYGEFTPNAGDAHTVDIFTASLGGASVDTTRAFYAKSDSGNYFDYAFLAEGGIVDTNHTLPSYSGSDSGNDEHHVITTTTGAVTSTGAVYQSAQQINLTSGDLSPDTAGLAIASGLEINVTGHDTDGGAGTSALFGQWIKDYTPGATSTLSAAYGLVIGNLLTNASNWDAGLIVAGTGNQFNYGGTNVDRTSLFISNTPQADLGDGETTRGLRISVRGNGGTGDHANAVVNGQEIRLTAPTDGTAYALQVSEDEWDYAIHAGRGRLDLNHTFDAISAAGLDVHHSVSSVINQTAVGAGSTATSMSLELEIDATNVDSTAIIRGLAVGIANPAENMPSGVDLYGVQVGDWNANAPCDSRGFYLGQHWKYALQALSGKIDSTHSIPTISAAATDAHQLLTTTVTDVGAAGASRVLEIAADIDNTATLTATSIIDGITVQLLDSAATAPSGATINALKIANSTDAINATKYAVTVQDYWDYAFSSSSGVIETTHAVSTAAPAVKHTSTGGADIFELVGSSGTRMLTTDAGVTTFTGSSTSPIITARQDSTGDILSLNTGGTTRFSVDDAGTAKIETSTTVAEAGLFIDQNDTDEPFIRFDGSSGSGSAASISTMNGDGVVEGPKNYSSTTGWAFAGMVRVSINGVDRWMPFYQVDTV